MRDAATVLLVRPAGAAGAEAAPSGGADFEVYMVRRHQGMAFMAGAYVFPGGGLDAADEEPRLLERLGDAPIVGRLEPTPGRDLPSSRAKALCIAAIRELFEEAGVLLARRASETELLGAAHPLWPALRAGRVELNERRRKFVDLIVEHDLVLCAAPLRYLAHWVTPSYEQKRFDARFFIAKLPEGQEAVLQGTEHVEHAWLAPDRALADHDLGKLKLPPPTLATLRSLRQSGDLAALLRESVGEPVHAVMPKIGAVENCPAVLFPWDPLYAASEGESFAETSYAPTLLAGPSRVVLRDGVWRAERG